MTDLTLPPFDPPGAEDAASRLAARAADAGLLDVAYRELDTPLGLVVAAVTPRGLVRLAYADGDGGTGAVLEDLARRVSPRVLAAPARLDPVARELEEYFAGTRTVFDLPLDWALTGDFGRRVLAAAAAVPYGHVVTYGAIALAAGNAKASRAAGRALGANPIPIVVPCHRIVGASGKLTGYTGGLWRKERLLALEGATL